jgi:hypothetical protein
LHFFATFLLLFAPLLCRFTAKLQKVAEK